MVDTTGTTSGGGISERGGLVNERLDGGGHRKQGHDGTGCNSRVHGGSGVVAVEDQVGVVVWWCGGYESRK